MSVSSRVGGHKRALGAAYAAYGHTMLGLGLSNPVLHLAIAGVGGSAGGGGL